MAVAHETTKRSQEILDGSQQVAAGISTYKKGLNKIVVPPDCCISCGQKKHSDKKDCPAKDINCSCGVKGHYRKLCFRNGKPRKAPRGDGKSDTKKEDNEAKSETGHSIHESCFSIKSEERTYPWVQGENSLPTLKMPSTLPVVNQPEEVFLASLQYSPGNDKWVDRARDEDSNQLHVLLKPMLDQWPQLHPNPACAPAKAKMKKTQSAGIADTGASVLCSGTNLMRQLGLDEHNLIPTSTVIRAANDAKLTVLGMVPVTVQVVGYQEKRSTQALYITRELTKLFVSRTCLLELGCLPKSWPYPPQQSEILAAAITDNLAPCGCPTRSETPAAPTKPPFPVTDTEGCRARLHEWLLEY